MRLIDADELIKKFRRLETNTEDENNMFSIARRMIKEEPTAFDVDKVVERIEKYQNTCKQLWEIIEKYKEK